MIPLILVVGASGSGKTTICKTLQELTEGVFKDLVSYTTRPMREGETNGVEHWFVDKFDEDESKVMAYTNFGGYDYWTSFDQLEDDWKTTYTYVIDEDGIRFFEQNLSDEWKNKIEITKVKIVRDNLGDIDQDRKARDAERHELPDSAYDIIVHNNTIVTLAVVDLLNQLNELSKKRLDKQMREFFK